jgi:transcription initiation factor TFIIE subunit alpha
METIIRMQKRRVLEKLAARLEYEKAHDFYFCYNSGCRRLTFEDAMESIFKCPKCGKNLQHFDNVKLVEALSCTVEALRKELESE